MTIQKYLKRLFGRMKWYEQAEYAAMLFTMAAAPLNWRVATVGMVLLALLAVVKAVAKRRFGNPALEKPQRWALAAMMALFAVYLASGFFSENRAYGLEIAGGKLCLLILPLAALAGDTRYLTHERMRVLFYTLGMTLVVTFLVCTGIAVGKMIGGTAFKNVLDHHFISTHHTYVALYLIVAMVFGYTEIMALIKQGTFSLRAPLPVCLLTGELLLTLFALAVNSRAGILAIVLLAAVAIADIARTTRKWRTVVVAVVVMGVVGGGLYALVPASRHRLAKTMTDVSSAYPKDARVGLMDYAFEAIERDMDHGRWLVGLGEGDYLDHLYVRYAAHGYKGGVKYQQGTHNQYMETFLACGAIGLAVLLWMLTAPLWIWRKAGSGRRKGFLVFFIMLALVTESMLGRQMGLFFIAYIYYLLILWRPKISA